MYIHMPYNQGQGDPSQYLGAMDPYEHQVICYFTQRKQVEKKTKDLNCILHLTVICIVAMKSILTLHR